MKNSIDINEFKYNSLNSNSDLKEELIYVMVKISQRIKYSETSISKNEKHLDNSFLKTINFIEEKSMDITLDYHCVPIIGLALAGEYGENARECYHKICKVNKQYNVENCDNEFSKHLKNASEIISMDLFHLLTLYGIIELTNILITKKRKEKKHKTV
ncbi:hypothetical protein QO200_19010 [Flavobacterium sp. Arc3]|uniref:hypothetical protein n=1 Tax=Flavobacterium sp. Arc3 TaxID=3046686 RepID=UPI00352C2F17